MVRHVLSTKFFCADLDAEIITSILAELGPQDLISVSESSKALHVLFQGDYVWRAAFNVIFPSPTTRTLTASASTAAPSRRRDFANLTSPATWRSEYVLRTRLLHSIARAKPTNSDASTLSPKSPRAGPVPISSYNTRLQSTVDCLRASFGDRFATRGLRFIHGSSADGSVSLSDPINGVHDWARTYHQFDLQAFADNQAFDALYGLGTGDSVIVPNVMDVSEHYGAIFGLGCPPGLLCYSPSRQQCRYQLQRPSAISLPSHGIPRIAESDPVCSIWIAKNPIIPVLSKGLVGIMSGSANGAVTAHSNEDAACPCAVTARWLLSPGVPIIAIAVDEQYSEERLAEGRAWVVALNALGEVFCLSSFPQLVTTPLAPDLSFTRSEPLDINAWRSGRTVAWEMLGATRRTAQPDPYGDVSDNNASYSPRSSSDAMSLPANQLRAETAELEKFLAFQPKHFRKVCTGWDMQRRLEVDFAGGNEPGSREAIVVIDTGLAEEGCAACITRYTRCTDCEDVPDDVDRPPSTHEDDDTRSSRASSCNQSDSSEDRTTHIQWRTSRLHLEGHRGLQITCSTMDQSIPATSTQSEAMSSDESDLVTPLTAATKVWASHHDMPGQRARHIAIGTKSGIVMIWNVRAPHAGSSNIVTRISPIRIIHTESPSITCLAMTALYLVHGGSDGLVQAWDPLCSTTLPIRTLHSRSSTRARRRLVQAEASIDGVGINLWAAGAICLDPDPTVLRGAVSLGTFLRYWSFSSSSADRYKSTKRRNGRRSERGSNAGHERLTPTAKPDVRRFMENERSELQREAELKQREHARLADRYGTALLGDDASEAELVAYATLLSEETLVQEVGSRSQSISPAAPVLQSAVSAMSHNLSQPERSEDADIAEAIRQSLARQEHESVQSHSQKDDGAVSAHEAADLDLALRLAIDDSEEVHGKEQHGDGTAAGGDYSDDFPVLSTPQSARSTRSMDSRSRGKQRM